MTSEKSWDVRADDCIARLESVLADEQATDDVCAEIFDALEPCMEPVALALFRATKAETALELVEHRGFSLDGDAHPLVAIAEGSALAGALCSRCAQLLDLPTPSPDVVEDAIVRGHPEAHRELVLPLVFRRRLLGALEIAVDGAPSVSAVARTRLSLLGRLIAVTLAEAWARRSALHEASRLERAREAEKAVIEALSVLPEEHLHAAVRRGFYVWPQYLESTVPEFISSVIQQVVDEARKVVGAEIAAIGIGDLPDRPFSPWAFSGLPESAVAAVGRTPRPVGTLGLVACQGETVRVADVQKHPSFRGLPPGHPPVKSMLGVPIRYRGRSLGNLYLANKIGADEFSLEDQRSAEALASQAAVALQQGVLQASVEAQRAQTQSLLDSAPHGILFVDGQTRRVMANPSAMRLLGETISPEHGVEQYIQRLRHPDGRPVPVEATPAFRALEGEEHPTEQFLIVRRDGTQIPVIESAAPVRGFGHKLIGAVVNFEDVSTVQDLERMRNIERVREEFNATIAHDLRNPIQTVLTQIFLLLKGATDDEVKVPVQALRRIERSASTLGKMAGMLLDVARIELNRLELRKERVQLRDVVAELLDRMRPMLSAQGHAIELSVAGELPVLDVDRLAFEQILTNLVDNAAKFSPEAAPIEVFLVPRDGGALLSVRDQGAGLNENEKACLFDRFRKVETCRDAGTCRVKRSGLGLGLFIVKGFVEAHGGSIYVDSEPGRGSTFHVWLPGPSPVTAGC